MYPLRVLVLLAPLLRLVAAAPAPQGGDNTNNGDYFIITLADTSYTGISTFKLIDGVTARSGVPESESVPSRPKSCSYANRSLSVNQRPASTAPVTGPLAIKHAIQEHGLTASTHSL